jgi:DNA processing protein
VPCPKCRTRSALLAILAQHIDRRRLCQTDLLAVLGLPNDRLIKTFAARERREIVRVVSRLAQTPATERAICQHDPEYPPALESLRCPPALLNYAGEKGRLLELLGRPMVALVGGRKHTSYGASAAFILGAGLAQAGVTVVNGLGREIESGAHFGAMHTGGSTIAVTPGGADVPYPIYLNHLHAQIRRTGAVISELPLGHSRPMPWCFLARSRIVAALAKVVIVIEAVDDAGCLYTAQFAHDLGREVGAVPGRITDPPARGVNLLLRDGAHPILEIQDVLDLLAVAR